MATYTSTNERSIWISALSNRIAEALMIDVKRNSRSMHNLCERIAAIYFPSILGRMSSSFQPIYNPQDDSQWPELLGWLVTIGEMAEVPKSTEAFEALVTHHEQTRLSHATATALARAQVEVA